MISPRTQRSTHGPFALSRARRRESKGARQHNNQTPSNYQIRHQLKGAYKVAKYTIDIADAAVPKLQAIVARYNADNGAALTVVQWLTLNAKEIAIQDELLAAAQTFEKQADADAHAAVLAERDRLLATV